MGAPLTLATEIDALSGSTDEGPTVTRILTQAE
jgi:hypothetical protein